MSANEVNISPRKSRSPTKKRKANLMRYKSVIREATNDMGSFSDLVMQDPLLRGMHRTNASALKAVINSFIEGAATGTKSDLQKKIDYYITPYNKNVSCEESMKFGDKFKK
jgi:hypothetical protein